MAGKAELVGVLSYERAPGGAPWQRGGSCIDWLAFLPKEKCPKLVVYY